jgi:hypothetical protein
MTLGNGGIDFDSGGTGSSTSYTDEEAVDAVGAALRSTSTVVAIYTDGANTIEFAALTAGSADTIVKPYVTNLTATTTSVFTVRTGTQTIYVEVVAGGGGGAGVAGSSTQAAIGSGGGASGYSRKWITSTATAYTYRVGPGGTGGSAGANSGNAGADSVFAAGNSPITVKAGAGGFNMPSGTAVATINGGVGGAAGTGGDINSGGTPGTFGVRGNATDTAGGSGAPGPWGGGGDPAGGGAAGNAATGPGAGGSGGNNRSINVSRAGGNGADGVIIVHEYVKE